MRHFPLPFTLKALFAAVGINTWLWAAAPFICWSLVILSVTMSKGVVHDHLTRSIILSLGIAAGLVICAFISHICTVKQAEQKVN